MSISLVSRSIETVVAMRVRHATGVAWYHGVTGEGLCVAAARNYGSVVVYFGGRRPGVLAPRGVVGSGGVYEGTLIDNFSHTNPDLGHDLLRRPTWVTRG